jgi:DNA modification methylase
VPADLIRGDALRIPLRDSCVDLIATSPPYFALRSYQDDGSHYDGQIGSEDSTGAFLAALWAVTDELWRVLKPTGSLFVNLGDSYAGSGGHNNAGVGGTGRGPGRYNQSRDVPVKSLRGLPWRFALGLTCPDTYRTDGVAGPQWTLRAELIHSKVNSLPEPVTDRVRRSHENWFHLTRGPKYYAAVDEIREVQQSLGKGRPWSNDVDGTLSGTATRWGEATGAQGLKGHRTTDQMNALNPLGKSPGSVWAIASEPLYVPEELGVQHYAAFAQEIPRRLILGWTPNGICTACGEGRRPVVEKDYQLTQETNNPYKWDGNDRAHGEAQQGVGRVIGSAGGRSRAEATITGYRCACDVTLAPTRPSLVLDPFVGTGTVPMVARALGRYGVGIDLSRDYLRLARWRINRSGHGSKSTARTNRERQGSLW